MSEHGVKKSPRKKKSPSSRTEKTSSSSSKKRRSHHSSSKESKGSEASRHHGHRHKSSKSSKRRGDGSSSSSRRSKEKSSQEDNVSGKRSKKSSSEKLPSAAAAAAGQESASAAATASVDENARASSKVEESAAAAATSSSAPAEAAGDEEVVGASSSTASDDAGAAAAAAAAGSSSMLSKEFERQCEAVAKALRASGPVKLADFKALQTVGTGTFGRVFLVQHNESHRHFAMKVMRKEDIVRLKQVDHIKNEREILSLLRHPFIVTIHAAFQDSAHLYMVLEYVLGGEVFSHLRRMGRFTAEMARFYASEIVLALEHMHSQHIVYRDLKPENLLLDSEGHIKITDFGFAKRVEDRTWTLCGTPEYLAPEIIQSQGHDKAVDWWALGIFLFEMLAGYPPFFDDNPFGIYEKILAGRIHFPAHFDRHAQDLIRRLLTPNRSRRLGNLRGGADDVKRHKWFKGVDWSRLANREFKAPIIPVTSHDGDTQNFEEYDEDWDWSPQDVDERFRDCFNEFVDIC